jgi:hypothetical protein
MSLRHDGEGVMFDRLMIDPTADGLVRALAEAARAANDAAGAHADPVPVYEGAWARRARRWVFPQGTMRFTGSQVGGSPAAHVAVAWWADAIGRRHVRVRGLASPAAPPVVPALAEVYPDRALVRRRGRRADVRVVCACGQGGDPAALGWMGDRCGPCHDRSEEGWVAPADVLVVPDDPSPARDVGFVPGPQAAGRMLLASHPDGVRCWDLDSGTWRLAWKSRKGDHDLLPLPDGRRVVVEERGADEVSVRDLVTGRRKSLARECTGFVGLALSPDARSILIGGSRPRCLDLRTRAVTPLTGAPAQRGGCRPGVAFTPDGRYALFATDAGTIFRADVGDGLLTPLTEALGGQRDSDGEAAFSADGRRLVYSRRPHQRGAHVWLGEGKGWQELRRSHRGRTGFWVMLTPDASTVVMAEYTGRIEFWDPDGPRCLGSLHGPRHRVTALAFSPDLTTLAVATQDGAIRLWPWRQLLEG